MFTYHTQYGKYAHYLPFPEKMVSKVAVAPQHAVRRLLRRIIAPSSDVKTLLESRGVTTPIWVIPTGVDLERFRRGSRTMMRQRLEIPESAQALVLVSRLAQEKNVEFVIEAFADLAPGRTRNSGWSSLAEAMPSQPCANSCEPAGSTRALFAGVLTGRELVSGFKCGDLFVFSSVTETQGMVVLEAMAAGLPVVAVDAPGVRDVVSEEENGFLVPEGDADAFAARVRQVLDLTLRCTHRSRTPPAPPPVPSLSPRPASAWRTSTVMSSSTAAPPARNPS